MPSWMILSKSILLRHPEIVFLLNQENKQPDKEQSDMFKNFNEKLEHVKTNCQGIAIIAGAQTESAMKPQFWPNSKDYAIVSW
jgi:hypothetical protein